LPTVVFATERFEGLAREAAAQSGVSDARIVTVEHPIGGIPKERLTERADRIVDAVLLRLTSGAA
jgi:hypothetical protein